MGNIDLYAMFQGSCKCLHHKDQNDVVSLSSKGNFENFRGRIKACNEINWKLLWFGKVLLRNRTGIFIIRKKKFIRKCYYSNKIRQYKIGLLLESERVNTCNVMDLYLIFLHLQRYGPISVACISDNVRNSVNYIYEIHSEPIPGSAFGFYLSVTWRHHSQLSANGKEVASIIQSSDLTWKSLEFS